MALRQPDLPNLSAIEGLWCEFEYDPLADAATKHGGAIEITSAVQNYSGIWVGSVLASLKRMKYLFLPVGTIQSYLEHDPYANSAAGGSGSIQCSIGKCQTG